MLQPLRAAFFDWVTKFYPSGVAFEHDADVSVALVSQHNRLVDNLLLIAGAVKENAAELGDLTQPLFHLHRWYGNSFRQSFLVIFVRRTQIDEDQMLAVFENTFDYGRWDNIGEPYSWVIRLRFADKNKA